MSRETATTTKSREQQQAWGARVMIADESEQQQAWGAWGKWAAVEERRKAHDGKWYTQAEFEEYYHGLDEWNDWAEMEEWRKAPDGNAYTKAEFELGADELNAPLTNPWAVPFPDRPRSLMPPAHACDGARPSAAPSIVGVAIRAARRASTRTDPPSDASRQVPPPRAARAPSAAVGWSIGLKLEQRKEEEAQRSAHLCRAARHARRQEGRIQAAHRDDAWVQVSATSLIDPHVILCGQMLEKDGGAFGCVLPAGHDGPHVL